jgi:ABC-type branched-subunit amino acid transport system ATPase component
MTSNTDQPLNGDAESRSETSSLPPRGRLTRLKVNRFRQVKPGTELAFDDGINVLLGRNGTGKTTLLELICALVSGDLRAYQREDFDLEFELLLTGEVIVILARNEIDFIDGNDAQSIAWHYQIRHSRRDGSSYQIVATKGKTQLMDSEHAQALPFPEAPLFSPGFYESCIRLVLRSGATNFSSIRHQSIRLTRSLFRLDEGLDVFRALTEGRPLPRTGMPLAATLFSGFPWRNPEEPVRMFLELAAIYFPSSLLERLLERGESAHSATEISISSTQWQLLEILRTLINVKSLQVTLQLVERKELKDGAFSSTFGKPVFRATTHRGTTFTHDQLSYGEKRLLAFMYHAAANPEILVADELVNGLHYEWIQACLDAIQGQAFLTSQNPLLLDHLPFSSGKEVQRRFVLCDRDEQGNWIWRNMDQDAADAFYRAYEVGIQHVSEILETKGLW